jgi:hypothetical protein
MKNLCVGIIGIVAGRSRMITLLSAMMHSIYSRNKDALVNA